MVLPSTEATAQSKHISVVFKNAYELSLHLWNVALGSASAFTSVACRPASFSALSSGLSKSSTWPYVLPSDGVKLAGFLLSAMPTGDDFSEMISQ